MRVVLISLLLWAPLAIAQQPDPPADVRAVQAFIDRARSSCSSRPAQACVDAGWRFAAASPKQGLTLVDVQTLRRRLAAWYHWHQSALPARELRAIVLGLLLADGIGLGRLHAAFDGNGDGKVTQKELLADVKLDSRPLGKVLNDPAAVDRTGLARRLGLPPALVEDLFR
jgi:hypothetical protein